MKRSVFIISIFFGCSLLLQAQKSKVIAVFQLIETGKYDEAKKAVEEAISDKKTRQWARTWYARGLLCQTAYQKGIAEKDQKKYELYPDQLYVAFNSYEKARSLDKRGKLEEQLAPMYVHLANDFQSLGEKHYLNKQYPESLKAFEQALQVYQSPILPVRINTNLIYNAALAAYESEEWDKAIEYFDKLNKENYSPNVTHLLYTVYIGKGDTTSAEGVLMEGIDRYEDNEDLLLLLVDLLMKTNAAGKAVTILDRASSRNPSKYIFPYTKGLVYQKGDQYSKAIEAYQEAVTVAPGEPKIYSNIGTCYYNIGVEIEKNARTITQNRAYLAEKERSVEAFRTAVKWFEEALGKDPDNQYVITKLYQLYRVLGISDKMENLEGMIR